MSRIRWR